jgi:hypothetical protein
MADLSLPRLQKVQQIKEEELNIIYQIFRWKDQRILLGFYGNFAYIWNQTQSFQLFSVDTKGGNRPIRLKLTDNCGFMLAYSFGDQIVIWENEGAENKQ